MQPGYCNSSGEIVGAKILGCPGNSSLSNFMLPNCSPPCPESGSFPFVFVYSVQCHIFLYVLHCIHRDEFQRSEGKKGASVFLVPRVRCLLPLDAALAAIGMRFDSDLLAYFNFRTPRNNGVSNCPQHRHETTRRGGTR